MISLLLEIYTPVYRRTGGLENKSDFGRFYYIQRT